ncbi:MAG: hypothetical protein Q8O00_15540 [Holophaga sp.]|nr:hypothetical protein [Holophaga sp.]
MSEAHLIPNSCQTALTAIEAEPLTLSPEVQTHLRTCAACAEARVQWLALEEAPFALAPAGYFENLPGRIQRKLPSRPNQRPRFGRWMWAAAAVLLMTGVGITGFWLGRANQQPLVEATLPRTPSDVQELLPEAPFQDAEDAMAQLSRLSKAEAEAVLNRMDSAKTAKP